MKQDSENQPAALPMFDFQKPSQFHLLTLVFALAILTAIPTFAVGCYPQEDDGVETIIRRIPVRDPVTNEVRYREVVEEVVETPPVTDTGSDASAPAVVTSIKNAKLILINDIELASRDGGIVEEIKAAEGDTVTAGQLVIQLDRKTLEAEAETAARQLAIASAESDNDVDFRFAEKSTNVNQRVYQRALNANRQYERSISKTEVERLQLEFERSELSLQQAENTMKVRDLTTSLREAEETLTRVRLENRDLQSPIDGQVVEVFAEPGEFVSPGQAVMRIIRLNRLKVETYIESEIALELRRGQPAEFIYNTGDSENDSETAKRSAVGEIVFVSPEIDPANRDVRVMVEIDNASGDFRPGMIGTLRVLELPAEPDGS